MYFEYRIEFPINFTIRIEGPDRSMAMAWLREVLGDRYTSIYFHKVEQPTAESDVVLNEAVEPIRVRFPFTIEQEPWLWWRGKLLKEESVLSSGRSVFYYTSRNETVVDDGECKPIKLHKEIFKCDNEGEQLAFGVLMEEFCDPYIAANNCRAFCEECMSGAIFHEERWDIRDWLNQRHSDFDHVGSVLIEEIKKLQTLTLIGGPHWKGVDVPDKSAIEHAYEVIKDERLDFATINVRMKKCPDYIGSGIDLTKLLSLMEPWCPRNGYIQTKEKIEKRIHFQSGTKMGERSLSGVTSLVGSFRDHLFHINFYTQV